MVRHASYWYYAYFLLEFFIGAIQEKNKQRKRKNTADSNISMQETIKRDEENVQGKVVLITGANAGLGKCTATQMAKRGAVVVMGCRNLEKGDIARKEIMDDSCSATVELYHLDLSDLSSVRSFAEQVLQKHSVVDILINNGGVSIISKTPPVTKEGWDMTIATNHLGHFLLTNLLVPSILPSPIGRIVTVSSTGCIPSTMDIDNLMMTKNGKRKLGLLRTDPYQNSKLANALFMKAISKKYPTIKAYSICPGFVKTEIHQNWQLSRVKWLLLRAFKYLVELDVQQGAEAIRMCSLDKRLCTDDSGGFFRFGRRVRGIEQMLKDKTVEDLWKVSEEYVNLKVD